MTKVFKNAHGNWTALDEVPIPGMPAFHLRFNTQKVYSGELVTHITGQKDEGRGMICHRMIDDYSLSAMRSRVRCSEAATLLQHQNVLSRKDEFVAAAVAFYKAKGELK